MSSGVKVRPNEPIDRALRRFSKIVEPELAVYRKRMQYYEKPSVERHRQDALRKRDNKKRREEERKRELGILPRRKKGKRGSSRGKRR